MHGDLLDLLLIALAVLAGFGDFRRGLICSITSFVGFAVGAVIGVHAALSLARGILSAPSNAIADDQAIGQRRTLAVVLVLAAIGNFAGQWLGGRLRALIAATPLGPVDGVGGAVISVISLLAVAWLFALALAYGPLPAGPPDSSQRGAADHRPSNSQPGPAGGRHPAPRGAAA